MDAAKQPFSLLFTHSFMSHGSYSSRIFGLQYLPFKMWCSNYQRLAQSSGKVTEENLPGISLGGGSARREEEDWFGLFRLGSEAGNACHGRGEAHWHSLRDEWRRWRMRERERESEWRMFFLIPQQRQTLYSRNISFGAYCLKISNLPEKMRTFLVHKYGIFSISLFI